jgi:hypothetical protein
MLSERLEVRTLPGALQPWFIFSSTDATHLSGGKIYVMLAIVRFARNYGQNRAGSGGPWGGGTRTTDGWRAAYRYPRANYWRRDVSPQDIRLIRIQTDPLPISAR